MHDVHVQGGELPRADRSGGARRRVLVAGWFSFENGHATAGDLIARDLAVAWLEGAGRECDVAIVPPFSGGVDWRHADPDAYSEVVFVCGPYGCGELESAFLRRFVDCRLVGLNLSMELPLDTWNPFDWLVERDSTRAVNADIVFLGADRHVPVIGLCLVEGHPEADVDSANAAIEKALAMREAAVVPIDTRLDVNETGLRTPREIESLIARMDLLATTRLHGMVLAVKNAVPALVIDTVPGGGKITRQARKIGWPHVLPVDGLTADAVAGAIDHGLSAATRQDAAACRRRAWALARDARAAFLKAFDDPTALDATHRERTAPQARQRFIERLLPESGEWGQHDASTGKAEEEAAGTRSSPEGAGGTSVLPPLGRLLRHLGERLADLRARRRFGEAP